MLLRIIKKIHQKQTYLKNVEPRGPTSNFEGRCICSVSHCVNLNCKQSATFPHLSKLTKDLKVDFIQCFQIP